MDVYSARNACSKLQQALFWQTNLLLILRLASVTWQST